MPVTGPLMAQREHGFRSNQAFEPLPSPTGQYPYRLRLLDVIPGDPEEIAASGLVFHCVGDTGGVKDPAPQLAVAAAMAADLTGGDAPPSFFYHLGDVVYFSGQSSEYYPQFYEPYADYPIPIFAIPGNHDGALGPGSTGPSLAAFVENFCAVDPHLTAEADEVDRHAMTQPNVYWTLLTPLVTIIGLYSNVPDGGHVRNDQAAWLKEELKAADPDLPVIVAIHHPIYSLDSTHGGNAVLQHLLDGAFEGAGRAADAVLSAHVHNYQRFVRTRDGREIPYIVAGAGGYHHLHRVPAGTPNRPLPVEPADVRIDKYCHDHYGFLRLTVTATAIHGEYVAVTRHGAVTRDYDKWTLDLSDHTVR